MWLRNREASSWLRRLMSATSRDITERIAKDQQLETERQLLHATIRGMRAGVLAVDDSGSVIAVNAAFGEITGTDFTVGTNVHEFADAYALFDGDGNVLPVEKGPVTRALVGATVDDEPHSLRRDDGQVRELLVSASPITDGGDRAGAVLTFQDVTEIRAAEAELRSLATTDMLTGLANRRTITDHLATALRRHHRTPERVSVIFLDLDGFKAVNDSLGHEAGDDLLIAAAERITSTLRVGDIVGRHGGDEFVIIAEQIDQFDARELVERVEAELAKPFLLPAGVVHIGGSAGLAQAHDRSTPDTLLADADVAMYNTKHRHHRARSRNGRSSRT